jgi:hypothetical protein
MKRRTLVIALILLTVPVAGFSQEKDLRAPESTSDVQARVGFDLSKKITRGLHIVWGEELRLKNTMGAIDRIQSSLGATYRINSWLKVGGAYTFISTWHDPRKSSLTGEKYWDLRHRAHLEALFTYRTGNWRFSFRERPQVTYRTEKGINPVEKRRWDVVLRHRFKVEYDVFTLPLEPYVSVELSNTLNAPDIVCNYLEKVRSMVGVKWQLSRRNSLDFYCRFDYGYGYDIDEKDQGARIKITPEKEYNAIVGLFYEYSF